MDILLRGLAEVQAGLALRQQCIFLVERFLGPVTFYPSPLISIQIFR